MTDLPTKAICHSTWEAVRSDLSGFAFFLRFWGAGWGVGVGGRVKPSGVRLGPEDAKFLQSGHLTAPFLSCILAFLVCRSYLMYVSEANKNCSVLLFFKK